MINILVNNITVDNSAVNISGVILNKVSDDDLPLRNHSFHNNLKNNKYSAVIKINTAYGFRDFTPV